MKNRIRWIDTTKGIGIFLVIIGHTMIDNTIRGEIYSFHMPLFFLVSGFLFSVKKYNNFFSFILSKMKSLLIPYLSFSIVSLLIIKFIQDQPIDLSQFLSSFLLSRRNNIFYDQPLWFLTSLFTIEVIYYLFIKLIKINYLIFPIIFFISMFSFTYLGVLQGTNILPWSLDQSMYYILYFGIGTLLKETGLLNKDLKRSYPMFMCSFIYILLIIDSSYFYTFFDLIRNLGFPSILFNFLANVVWANLAILFVIYISQFLTAFSFLDFLGRNTLILLALHVTLGFTLFNIWLVNGLNFRIENPNLLGLFISIFTVLLLIPVIYLINNYLPFLVGKNLKLKGQNKEKLLQK